VNKEKLAMPVELKIVQTNGKTEVINLPVNIWQRGAVWTFKYPSTSPIESVTIDPYKHLPDIDLKNNVFKPAK
jgi:hypothetical protein